MTKHALLFTVLLALLCASPALANFIPFAQPVPAYTGATTLIPILGADFDFLTSIADANLTVSFSTDLQIRTVPDSWNIWGSPPDTEGSTPTVLYSFGASSLQLTLSNPASIFGFEAEPNLLGIYNMTASFYDGATLVGSISRSVDAGGALLFAASTDQAFTRITVLVDADAEGFAIGRPRESLAAAVPEPAVSLLTGGGLIFLAAWARRRVAPRR